MIRVIFAAILAEGRCTKRLDGIAALASVSRSTARNSIAEAVRCGLLEKQERRHYAAVSEPNVVTAPATTTIRSGSQKWSRAIPIHRLLPQHHDRRDRDQLRAGRDRLADRIMAALAKTSLTIEIDIQGDAAA